MKEFNGKNRLRSICKILTNIKNSNHCTSLFPILRTVVKNTFIFICSFIFTVFVCLLIQTKSPLSDIFTTGRISILKDRPKNITRDIVIDTSHFLEKGGMLTLTQSLIEDIAKKRPNWRLLILSPKCSYKLSDNPNVKFITVKSTPLPLIFSKELFKILKSFCTVHDKLTQLLYYDRIFLDNGCDLVWDPIGDVSFCNFVTVPRISTIHDIACLDVIPEFFPSINHQTMSHILINNAMFFSKKIITVSKFSQNRICNKFGVSKDFVKYIPIQLGSLVSSNASFEKSTTVLSKYQLIPRQYFIFCSTWRKNKNHDSLIKAFNKFSKTNTNIKLVLVGKHYGVFESRSKERSSSDRIIITGFVPDEELGILLKNALAFIHPSVYEGFGMPIIEAMVKGIPVACSNVSSLPEIAGSAALLFDPLNIDSITEAMHRLADDSEFRKKLILKGYEQAKKYSDRDAMVDEYIHVMEEVMEENDRKKASYY